MSIETCSMSYALDADATSTRAAWRVPSNARALAADASGETADEHEPAERVTVDAWRTLVLAELLTHWI